MRDLPCLDYLDLDMAYLLGFIIARGTLEDSGDIRRVRIELPYVSLRAEGITASFDQETAIQLGLHDVRERLLDLLSADIRIVTRDHGVDLVIQFLRNNIGWRNIQLLVNGKMGWPWFQIPEIFLSDMLPRDIKREFVRGFADVAGNIRHSNRYVDGRHRVRLDVLNTPHNWHVPIQLCTLLQEHLGVPVQLITWGHPNMNRDFREHQLNIFAKSFSSIGFSFPYKQKILEEFVRYDEENFPDKRYDFCPGKRNLTKHKPPHPDESSTRLDSRLLGRHIDAYWQICKSLSCTREPPPTSPPALLEEIVEDAEG